MVRKEIYQCECCGEEFHDYNSVIEHESTCFNLSPEKHSKYMDLKAVIESAFMLYPKGECSMDEYIQAMTNIVRFEVDNNIADTRRLSYRYAIKKMHEVLKESSEDKSIMDSFIATVRTIRHLQSVQRELAADMEQMVGMTLSGSMHWILEAAIEGKNHSCLTVHTCNEVAADKLRRIGFNVSAQYNVFQTLSGHDVSWDNIKDVE